MSTEREPSFFLRRAALELLVVVPLSAGCGAASASALETPVPVGETAVQPASDEPAPMPSTTAASEPTHAAGAKSPAPAGDAGAKAPASSVEPLPSGLRVLVIGDSFAQALGMGLKATAADNGLVFTLQGQQATYIPEWAGPNKNVAGMLVMHKPDLVVISLGGNELAMVDPSVRAPKVERLVEILGDTPCVWVAPPLWGNKDNGLLAILQKHSAPCRYFDSNQLSSDLPRGSDKIHPTTAGQKQWADRLLEWLRNERDPEKPGFALRTRPNSE
jgi:lysophospholipase L1-like esterase